MDNFAEVGRTGLQASNGVVFEEFLQQLRGAHGRKVLREMADNDPVIGGILLAFEKTLSRLDWHIEVPEDASPKDREVADFVQECFEDMSDSWTAQLSGILSCIVYGWSYHEIVYKKREGDRTDPANKSRFDDGRIGWRKWPIRTQESLVRWEFDENGGIQGMVQQVYNGGTFTIPIEKSLLFRTTTAKGNPEGRPLIRNAYRPYYFKKRIEEIEAIGIERDLAGLPVAWLHPNYFSNTASPDEIALLATVNNIVTNIKRNESEGLVMPLQYDDKGNKMIDLELMSTGGARQFDTDKIITRYNQQIAMSVLADFMMLGHDAVGSRSLGESKIELWMMAVEAVAKAIAEVVNQHAIPRLLKLNGMKTENLPELVFGTVENIDLTVLSTYIKTLADAGVLVSDGPLEDYVREIGNLPPRDEEADVMDTPEPPQPVFGVPDMQALQNVSAVPADDENQ